MTKVKGTKVFLERDGKPKARTKDKCKLFKLPKRGGLIIEHAAKETINDFDDSTILAGDRIVQLDDDDYDLFTDSVLNIARPQGRASCGQ